MAALLLLGATPTVLPGRAQDSLIVQTNFYEIRGSTARELRASLNRARPWRDRTDTDAETKWNVQWSYGMASGDASCRLQHFSTRVTITFTLPRWSNAAEAPEALRQHWARYLDALFRHEQGHQQFAQAAAGEIKRQVKALPPQPTCAALTNLVVRTAQGVLEDFGRKEKAYDEKTRHGTTQGARFP